MGHIAARVPEVAAGGRERLEVKKWDLILTIRLARVPVRHFHRSSTDAADTQA